MLINFGVGNCNKCSDSRLRLQQFWKTDSDSRLRLQQFWKTDSDSSSFKKPTPTPAENMRLHRLRLLTPTPQPWMYRYQNLNRYRYWILKQNRYPGLWSRSQESESVESHVFSWSRSRFLKTAGVGVGSRFFKTAGVGVGSRSRFFKTVGVGVGTFVAITDSKVY